MNSNLQSIRRRGLVYLFSGVFALGGIIAAVQGAQSTTASKGSISLKRDDQPVNRGQLEPASFATVVKKVSPSVVTINVEGRSQRSQLPDEILNNPYLRQLFNGRQLEPQMESGLGSGVIISADGYIATNNHVVENADKLSVTLSDGRVFKGKLIGRDPDTEVAVIKIEAKDLPAITMADSSKVEVGDRVLAIGNPFGIGETVTSGIVSATGRRVGIMDRNDGLEDFIQTDASINPGNSGGALIDVQGRLIGLNTAIIGSGASNGVGLAVPANIVSHVTNSLVETGKVTRGIIGVTVRGITPDLMDAYSLKSRAGAFVEGVTKGGAAEKAGFKEEDVIVAIDGRAIEDSNKLPLMVSQMAPGATIDVEVIRDGASKHLKPVVAAREDAETVGANNSRAGGLRRNSGSAGNSSNGFGFAPQPRNAPKAPAAAPEKNDDDGVLNGVGVTELDARNRRQYGIPASVKGALITEVDPNSASADAGLKPGQVITTINRKAVSNMDEAIALTEKTATRKTQVRTWSPDGMMTTVVNEE